VRSLLSALGVVVWSLHSLLVYTSDYILYIRLVTVNCIYSCLIRWSYTVESYYNVDYASLSIHWLLLGVICHWCTSTHNYSHVIAARRLGMYVLESHVDAGLTAGDLVPCAVCCFGSCGLIYICAWSMMMGGLIGVLCVQPVQPRINYEWKIEWKSSEIRIVKLLPHAHGSFPFLCQNFELPGHIATSSSIDASAKLKHGSWMDAKRRAARSKLCRTL
jgi:hypothetical protein